MTFQPGLRFCGEPVSEQDFSIISEICGIYAKLSQTEIASTICELLNWRRSNGKLKTIECYQFLNQLNKKEQIQLPQLRSGRPLGSKTCIKETDMSAPQAPCQQALADLKPVRMVLVEKAASRRGWQEYMNRYHYLGYKTPFGAQLRYFIESEDGPRTLGCLQFSSPALKLRARDEWIGWTQQQKGKRLQFIVQNSRFLIFPWIQVKNLASHVLGLAARQIKIDWQNHFGRTPVLLETFVDTARFRGTCYRAANWIHLGVTQGRGRMDTHCEFPSSIKDIWVMPLKKKWKRDLLVDFTRENLRCP